MTFINILVDILDGLDRCNGLDINMAAIFPQQPRAVWDYLAVVYFSF